MTTTLRLKLAAGTFVVLVGTLIALRGHDLKVLAEQGLEFLRLAGPVPFFVSMALLPALGAPISLFTVTAGSAFAPKFGMQLVIAMSLGAIATNVALSYFLARWALRPILASLLTRLGYTIPRVNAEDFTNLTILVRVTPGVPFPVQNYLLGLAAAPFWRYLTLSCMIAFPLNAAIIILGDALLRGRGRMALLGLLLVIAILAATRLVRRHWGPGHARPDV